jgi:glycosyltransferase involved in cell wall biosynthesis
MAMERCLVVSGVGALLEIVEAGETGLSFTAEDPTSLADTVEPLLDDPAERARLGANAREWVKANRTWRRNGELYRALYESIGAV